jgi:hypothetical protein
MKESGGLLALAADALADEICKAAFRILAELVVVRGFLADHEASAMIAGVEPFRGGRRHAAGAIEAHPRPHFDERPALRKFCGLFEFHPYQRKPLIILEHSNGTDRHLIAAFGLADAAPVPGGQYPQADDEHDHDNGDNDKGFFQRRFFPKRQLQEPLSSKKAILSTASAKKFVSN